MTVNTKIEWCEHTINFWWGCEKVSPGCAHCYAEGFAKRVGDDIWGRGQPRRWIKSAADTARKLNAQAEREGVRYKVFCNSMSDFLEEDHGQRIVVKSPKNEDGLSHTVVWHRDDIGPCTAGETTVNKSRGERLCTLTDLRQQAFQMIDECQHLDWLIVTKRPENIWKLWEQRFDDSCRSEKFGSSKTEVEAKIKSRRYRSNVWLLTSVENQEQADERIPQLLRCRDLVAVLGLSMEPLLGPVQLSPSWNYGNFDPDFDVEIDWVIIGGESGHNARPMHPDWVRNIRNQCQTAGVTFFFKQWGEWYPLHGTGIPTTREEEEVKPFCWVQQNGQVNQSGCEPSRVMIQVGKKAAGRMLDNQEWSQFPEVQR